MKKFELTGEFKILYGRKLFRIRALVNFRDVESGDLGGYVEKEENLSHDGDAWVYGNAQVYGNAKVYGNALVCGEAQVFGNARVYANAQVFGNARVYGNAQVYGNAKVYGNARVYANAQVYGNAQVFGNARLYGNAWVCGEAQVYGNAQVFGYARLYGNAKVCGEAQVRGDADYACIKGFGSEYRSTTFFRTKDGDIGVRCGCFYGTLNAFREKVKETHGDTKYAQEYLMISQLMELHFVVG